MDTSDNMTIKRNFNDMISNTDEIKDNTTFSIDSTAMTNDTTSVCSDITTNSGMVNLIEDILTDKITKRVKVELTNATGSDSVMDILKLNTASTIEDDNKVDRMRKLCAKKYTRKSTKRWSDADKTAFYDGLKCFGLNYDMICATFMKNRSTKEVAAFLKKEDIRNITAVDEALDINKKNKFLMDVDARNKIIAMI